MLYAISNYTPTATRMLVSVFVEDYIIKVYERITAYCCRKMRLRLLGACDYHCHHHSYFPFHVFSGNTFKVAEICSNICHVIKLVPSSFVYIYEACNAIFKLRRSTFLFSYGAAANNSVFLSGKIRLV